MAAIGVPSLPSIMEMSPQEIVEEASKGRLKVAVVGCGWMGLPTALLFAEAGVKVIGVVKDEDEAEKLNRGESTIAEPGVEELLRKHLGSGAFKATTDTKTATAQTDASLIIVPTLVGKGKRPDYSAVIDACRGIGRGLRRGCLVILESTVGPGITEELVKPELEAYSGLKAGKDFGLAYSPIRASAGTVLRDLASYPRIVAGIDERSFEKAAALLSLIVKGGIIKVRDLKTAEAVKLFENIYRDVNIALANQLALFCEAAGIDVAEAFNAANTQPHCHLHKPGVGVGGHCLPSNPYFLLERARKLKVNLDLVRLARRINDSMPMHTIRLITAALRSCGKTLKGSHVAVLGASFKEDIKEARYSPSIQIAEKLMRRGVKVTLYDPYFASHELNVPGVKVTDSIDDCVRGADCVLIAVAHSAFKQLDVARLAKLVNMPAALVDGKQVVKPEEARKVGFLYAGVGRGLLVA